MAMIKKLTLYIGPQLVSYFFFLSDKLNLLLDNPVDFERPTFFPQ